MSTEAQPLDTAKLESVLAAIQALEQRLASLQHRALVNSPWLTTAEAAAYLKFDSTAGLREHIKRGTLRPDGKRGLTFLFRVETLDAFVANGLPEKLREPRADRVQPPPVPRPPRTAGRKWVPPADDPYAPPPWYKPDRSRLLKLLEFPPPQERC